MIRNSRTSPSGRLRASGSPRAATELGSSCRRGGTSPAFLPFLTCSSSSTRYASMFSGFLELGEGILGVARIIRTLSACHRWSLGTLLIVLHLAASPLGLIIMCSPVRPTCPTQIPSIDLQANFFFCLLLFPCPKRLEASLARTNSPNSTIGLLHFLPVVLSCGVIPSLPTLNLFNMNTACSSSHWTTGRKSSMSTPSRASSASLSVRVCALTSCTAFSQGPLLAGS